MSLRIDIDIADSLISTKAFTVSDNVLRGRDPADFQYPGLWVIPGAKATTLLPDQVRADWGVTGAVAKWQLTDWMLDTNKWEQIARRGPGDYFLLSKGLATGSLVSQAALVENGGLYVEVFGYGVPGTIVNDLLQVSFAGGLVLHIHSNGRADLEDRRPGTMAQTGGTAVYLTKNQSLTGGTQVGSKVDLLGKLLGIVIFPYRRGRLLVITNQGGEFEVFTGGRDDPSDTYKDRRAPGESVYHLTTEAGQVTLTPSPTVRALLAANPLTCQQALTGLLTSPLVSLPYATAVLPTEVLGEVDAQDGTSVLLSVLNPDGSTFAPSAAAPADSLLYQVAFESPSPMAFPILYSLEMRWARALGAKAYGTTTVPTTHTVTGNVVSAKLTLSRDRQQNHFECEIDNPGEHYTSLKDLYNRLILVSFTPGGADSAFGIPAGEVLPVFLGLTDVVEFTDGTASRLRVPASGLRKRLKSHLLNDNQKYDAMLDTDVVRSILTDAGIDPAKMIIFDDGGTPLDSADPGEDALWRPTNGQSADEFIQHLADTWSGWVFDDIAGVYYYVPKEYFTAAALAQTGGVVQVYQSTPSGFSASATRAVNTGCLVALKDSVKQTGEEPRANDFWVLGQDDDGNIVSAHYEDYDSIHNRLAPNYVGERRTLIYASGSITTVEAAQRAIGPLVIAFGQALVNVSFDLPDYQITQLPLEGPLQLEGFGVGLITAIDADLSCDRSRRTSYTYEILQ